MQSFLDESAFSSRQFRFWYLFGLVLSSTIILFANKKKNSLITEHTYSAPTKWMRGKGRGASPFNLDAAIIMQR
jgi:hypothetical protein